MGGGYLPAGGSQIIYFAIKGNFFNRALGNSGVILNLFQSQKQLHLKSKLAWLVYTKNIKLKVQEQWLQLKIKFSLDYITWKLLFSWEDGEINPWWGASPIRPSRKTNIYIFTIVQACVLIPLANLNPAIFAVPRGAEKLTCCSRQTRSPDNSN